MKNIFAFIILVLGAVGFSDVQAQDRLMLKVGYNTAMPVGTFKDYMGKNSFRGYRGEILYPVNEQLKVGLGVTYNDFYEKLPRKLYQTSEETL